MKRRYVTAGVYREQVSRLTDHDLSVLACVSDLRFVSGPQLARLCFADTADDGARAARRALLRLVRLGALERLPRGVGGVGAGSAGFVYHLGGVGQRLAVERGWQPERRRRRSLVPGTLFVRHALMVSELHSLLVERDRSRSFELLELTAEPSCWRKYDGLGGQRQTLKPDSYARLGIGKYEYSYFIEVDMGTEGSRALERQLRLYVAYHRTGQEQAEHDVFPQVLWLTPNERRAAVIADSVQRLPTADRELFQVARFDRASDAMTPDETETSATYL